MGEKVGIPKRLNLAGVVCRFFPRPGILQILIQMKIFPVKAHKDDSGDARG
jgi:hypothetical protein